MQLVKEELQAKKVEGDKCTPRGRFKLKYIFYRKERIKIHIKTQDYSIKKNFGWCDDVNSKYYNKFVKLPFKYKAEKLYLKKNIYDIIVVLDYNLKPIKKKRKCNIFTYCQKNYSPTLGCVALSKSDLKLFF